MAESRPVVVDTNILFSALLRDQTSFGQTILGSGRSFHVAESVIVELFKHKEKIVRLSSLSGDDVVRLFYTLVRRLAVEKEDLIDPEHRLRASELCADIDPSDAPHVALALQLRGLLWTGDRTLKTKLTAKGFDEFFDPNT